MGCSRQLISKLSKRLGIGGFKTSSRYTGEHRKGWKGGKTVSPVGYVLVNVGRGRQRYEHCLIAEKAMGRRLRPGETVHHINGIKADNRNCNLLICTNAYHQWLEQRMLRLYKKEHFGGPQEGI